MSDQFWERLAQSDPLWAVLSEPSKRGRQWNVAQFFETGRREISLLMHQLRVMGCVPACGTVMDFGCGVGRLSQALAEYFDKVIGVDISPTMISLAEKLNRWGSRVRYVNEDDPRLPSIDTDSLDFIYSDIVLQHIEPDQSAIILKQFFRVLRPNGVAVIQLPSHKRPSGPSNATQSMPDEAYKASIQVLRGADTLPTESAVEILVSIVNESDHTWTESLVLRVGNHWRNATTFEMLVQDDGRTDLKTPFRPQQCLVVPLTISAPGFTGDYICEVDVVHEGVTWFADRGSRPAQFSVSVRDDETVHQTLSSPGPLIHHELQAPRGDIYADLPPYRLEPDDFPMFGISQEQVRRIVSTNGGRMILEEPDERCGREWVGFRYFVQKSG